MSRTAQTNIAFAVILLLTIASAVFIYPAWIGADSRPWHLGLDLVGGSNLVYEVNMEKVPAGDRDSVLSGMRDVMERRVNLFGVSEPQVYSATEGDSHRIIVELAGINNVSEAVAQIGRTALLNFRTIQGEGTSTDFMVSDLTGKYLESAQVVSDPNVPGRYQISIKFNGEGSDIFEKLTGDNIGKPLAIFVDDDFLSAPTVQDKISGGEAVISGQFSLDSARNLTNALNAGALPAPITLLSQQTISATLGIDSLAKAAYAGIVGTLGIVLFMLIFYRSLGVYAALALVAYVFITLALFKSIGITLTLAGIAGFILSIGMAVDANILIFERTREELLRGLARTRAIEEGFRRAWTSIRDSNISTIITSVILYYYTTSFVRGFALALLIGVLVSMFSAITITRTLMRMFIKDKQVVNN